MPTSPDAPSTLFVTAWPPVPGERSPCALFVVTADDRVRAANHTASTWFPGAALMAPFSRFIGMADLDLEGRMAELEAFTADLRSQREPRELRLQLYRHPGGIFPALLMATPLLGEDGQYLGFDATLLDLSRWRDREALVPRTQGEGERQQLQACERSLGQLQREMESLLQVMGHDVRGPLRHLQAYLQLVRERADALQDEALREYGGSAAQSARGLGRMIEAMHDYLHLCRARIEAQAVSLGPLVQGVIAHLPTAGEGRSIAWRIAPDLPTVHGDPMLLAQVFRHLLDNAVKFTRDVASPMISIDWSRTLEGEFAVDVADNGIGFDRGRATRLFLLFQRQHHSHDHEGQGVGLAMAHRIVERHGGQMFCDAQPGGGCKVRFTLPDAA